MRSQEGKKLKIAMNFATMMVLWRSTYEKDEKHNLLAYVIWLTWPP